MKECLKCGNPFQERRSTAKFCSNKCRAAYGRSSSGNTMTKPKMREMYNAVLSALNSINPNGQPLINTALFIPEDPKEDLLSYNQLKDLIYAATSSTELHKAWKAVEKNKSLAGWQLRELEKLKEYQRTKIDF